MPATFATIMLSRLSLAVAVLFAANAWKVFSLDRKAPANRVALVFNMVFALWALAASFWYGTSNRETAHMLYNFFSWTWCVFPPLILHFTVLVSDVRPRWAAGKVKLALLVLLYVPSVALALALPGRLIDEPAYRGGYWMLAVRHNGWYIAFILHYFLLVLASVVLAFRTSARSAASRVRKRLRILAWSYLAAGLLGFVTDTLFLALGVDFPNMAIIWIAILSIGMLTAMERHGLLTILPAKEALRVLSGMSGLVAYVDDAGKLIWANQSALDALGMDELEGARGLSLQDFLPEQAVAGIEGAKGTGSQPAEARCSFGPQGIPVSLRARVLGGRTEGVVLSAVDLRPERERARVERRLADADLVLDEFISRSLDGIALTDAAGTIVRWNEAMAHITGIPVGKALGMPYWEARAAIEPPEARSPERIRKAIDSALAGERARWTRRIVESEIVRGDGARRILQSDSFTLPLAEGLILATIARDVTDEKRQIEENIERVRNLDRAQKLEAIGTLSGGIAHDFNNTLAGIIGALSIIKQEIESGACSDPRELSREIDIIDRSAQRASSSVKRLLTLTRKRSPESKVFRLDEALQRVFEFSSSSIDSSVRISASGELPRATVRGDVGQVEQVLLNLVINAEHAMTIMRPKEQARGGAIRVRLEPFKPDRNFLAVHQNAHEGYYWMIAIEDEGVGIPRHALSRIFDPFFTTKPGESSTGLGLAMVQAIIQQHEGMVEVDSTPGKGTRFSVYLPAWHGDSEEEVAVHRPHDGNGLVLLADDDLIARETAEAMLLALGYHVEQAVSGLEALRKFMERPAEWVFALLDMRMGEMGGDEAGMRMRSVRPELPLILASGFHDESTPREQAEGSRMAVLDKPYTLPELSRAIEQILPRRV